MAMSTVALADWVERIPAVTDRTLLELVNGLGVARGVVAGRAELGPAARLLATVLGKERKGDLLTQRTLVDGQRTLVNWATEISEQQAVTNLTVVRVADHLRRTKATAEAAHRTVESLDGRFGDLVETVTALQTTFDRRLTELEQWRAGVDLRLAADSEFEAVIGGWRAGRLYSRLPWIPQVLLIARALAGGSCGEYDFRNGEPRFQNLIADAIAIELKAEHGNVGFSIAAELDAAWRRIPDPDERWLVAEVLDAGLTPDLALHAGPLSAIAATTLELASLPEEARPVSPARTATALARRNFERVNGTAQVTTFVERVVAETMAAAKAVWKRNDAGSAVPVQPEAAAG